MTADDLVIAIESVKNMLVAHATGGGADDSEFRRLRRVVVDDPRSRELTPDFLKTCRTLSEFWGFIKPQFPTYAERREFIRKAFDPLLSAMERDGSSAALEHGSAVLKTFGVDAIDAEFRKMLQRSHGDPGGAITSARTLLETICKHVLDDFGETYQPDETLPDLYGAVAKKLNLAPGQHKERVFKQALGGCFAVVEAIGAIRNALGDAHGQGRLAFRPLPRHAQLVINLASSAATFLVQTWIAP